MITRVWFSDTDARGVVYCGSYLPVLRSRPSIAAMDLAWAVAFEFDVRSHAAADSAGSIGSGGWEGTSAAISLAETRTTARPSVRTGPRVGIATVGHPLSPHMPPN